MTYRPNAPAPVASTTKAGVIKADGVTLTVATDATASVIGTAVTALTDISSGTLGGPAASDVDTLNRGGNDYKVTLSARSAFFRKSPAGSRTITLATAATNAVLTATDNDKQVIVTGIAGNLSCDGTIADGFRCFVVNKTGSALSYTGLAGLGGANALPTGSAAQIYMAASSIEAAVVGNGSTLTPATTAALGGVKPDGTSIAAASDGTLSVITTTTHALPSGSSVSGADEIATYSNLLSGDVRYSLNQIAYFAQSNIQSWVTGARPVPASGQIVVGYNSTLSRFDFWNGSAWVRHVRVSDLSATPLQLLGGTGVNGTAAAITVGAGLQLAGGTLSAGPAPTPVIAIATSGAGQALVFPASGSRAYDVTLSANCAFTVSGGSAGELQTITLMIRGGAGGFAATLPSNVKWKGGSPPAVDTAAGSLYLLRIQTSDGGATYAGNF